MENTSTLRVGFDLHGVIDKDPELFAELTKKLYFAGHEVYVLTGQELSEKLVETLKEYGISYDLVFSITTYHKEIGTPIRYKNGDKTQPLISPPKWDRTKADFAERVGLDLVIDDRPEYGKYFTGKTQFILYTAATRSFLKLLLED